MTEPNRTDEPSPPRSRLEDEVLEILVRTDQPTSLSDHVRRKTAPRPPARPPAIGRSLPNWDRLGPGSFLLGSLLLAFIGATVRDSSALLGTLLAIASFALLVMIWVRRSPAGGSNLKQWRGRDIDLSPPPPAWVESLRDRFRRPPRR